MQIKFLQLNIFMGKYLYRLLPYLYKEQFDILSFQEVSSGDVSFDNVNCFKEIANLGYDGELQVTWRLIGKKQGYYGKATFFKKNEFTLLDKKDVWLKPYEEVENLLHFDYSDEPKAVLHTVFEKEGIRFSMINAHLAWSKIAVDTPEKLRQGKIFYEYMKDVKAPFILSGDFNLAPQTKVVEMLDTLGRNLVKEQKITNTMNLRNHKRKEELAAKGGVTVDYMYVSKEFNVQKFQLLEDLDLSDHLGLYLETEIT